MNLDKIGAKEIVIGGKNINIKWSKRYKSRSRAESDCVYEGVTNIEDEEIGTQKTETIISRDTDKYTAWAT